jgi:hypothetical protein
MIDIILVHTGNFFPEHILDCISNLKKYNFKIHLIISECFSKNIFDDEIIICIEEDLKNESYNSFNSKLDQKFRDGFWVRTSSRFILLSNYAEKKKLKHFFHIENDVLLYDDFKNIQKVLTDDEIDFGCVIDSISRCIPSVVYFKDEIISRNLANYIIKNNHLDDMSNLFGFFKENRKSSINFPIHPSYIQIGSDIEIDFSNYLKKFNSIFDAAAIGQYLGGIDPRNLPGNTKGFVNEQSFIKPSDYRFLWEKEEPYLLTKEGYVFKINNLHIHSKNLKEFINKN